MACVTVHRLHFQSSATCMLGCMDQVARLLQGTCLVTRKGAPRSWLQLFRTDDDGCAGAVLLSTTVLLSLTGVHLCWIQPFFYAFVATASHLRPHEPCPLKKIFKTFARKTHLDIFHACTEQPAAWPDLTFVSAKDAGSFEGKGQRQISTANLGSQFESRFERSSEKNTCSRWQGPISPSTLSKSK